MKKLGCAQCGKVVKSLSKAQKGKTTNVPDRGDNSENYKYGNKDKWGRPTTSKWYGFNPKTKKYEYAAGGSTRIETRIPSGVTGPNMSPRTMKAGGMIIDPEKKAARQAKRTEKKITKQIKKSVMNSGKMVKAKRGGIKK